MKIFFRERKKNRIGLLGLVFSVLFAACVGWLVLYKWDLYTNEKKTDSMVREEKENQEEHLPENSSADVQQNGGARNQISDGHTNGETQTVTAEDSIGIPEEDLPVDFAHIREENPHIYAWIEIPDTVISYPVLRHPTDDSYYLEHQADGTPGYPGCIYSESLNDMDFEDFDTVLYGHNMKDGSMFGSLYRYSEPDFFAAHDRILIYTSERVYLWKIFAAFTADDRHVLRTHNFSFLSEREKYLAGVFEGKDMGAVIAADTDVRADDRLLTLSTCVSGRPNKRYLVMAKLVEEQMVLKKEE